MEETVIVTQIQVEVANTSVALESTITMVEVGKVVTTVVGLQGPPGPPGPEGPPGNGIQTTYVHEQAAPSALWVINHNLGRWPSITVTDTARNVHTGNYRYIDENSLEIEFSAPFSGYAKLN